MNSVARPSKATGPNDNEVSHAFWSAIAGVLTGKQKAGVALNDLAGKLAGIRAPIGTTSNVTAPRIPPPIRGALFSRWAPYLDTN
jgi:hypothetical protein